MIEGGEHLKPRAGPSLEVFRVMFLLSLTIAFLLLLTPRPVFPSYTSVEGVLHGASMQNAFINGLPRPSLKLLFDPLFLSMSHKSIFMFFDFES